MDEESPGRETETETEDGPREDLRPVGPWSGLQGPFPGQSLPEGRSGPGPWRQVGGGWQMRLGQFPQSRLTFAMGERDDVAPSPDSRSGRGPGGQAVSPLKWGPDR